MQDKSLGFVRPTTREFRIMLRATVGFAKLTIATVPP